ncbi:cell wall metabolism sensor histidine kinase WalK [Bacillus sp. Marseille-Q1617]|uniref:sensor histidine kinase n=1 Tax=Bacillus sp. Marseille-Q1617 TaxID=2736887 RepID=UPI00158A950D|nr:HAMP domain-containing sensor histidine kinase [Bacillus sp. Marseille-Q1617]
MKSLYVKFTVYTIGIMLLSGIIAFILSNLYYQQYLKPQNDQKNTRIGQEMAGFIEDHPEMGMHEYLEHVSSAGYQFYLVDGESEEGTFFGAPFRDKGLDRSALDTVMKGEVYHGIQDFPSKTFVTGFFANELSNTIGVPVNHDGKRYALFIRPDIKLLFNEMHLLFGWLLALTLFFSIVLIIIGTRYLIRPISKLTKATHSLAQGDYNVEVDRSRRDELGQLADSFQRMSKQLEQLDEIRKEFISNISHDIQSPLSNIKGYSNLLKSEDLSSDEKAQYISIMNGEIDRLSNLTKQLLLLASLDRNDDVLKVDTFNVSEQLKAIIGQYQWKISQKGIMLTYSLSDHEIKGDRVLLNTVWDNLLSNAIKYNRPHGTIDVTVEKHGGMVSVVFRDTGIGISEKESDRVFDRFYRADTSRTRTIEGTGLGLSIVSTIVNLHGGRVQLDSKPGKGTEFTVELPVK